MSNERQLIAKVTVESVPEETWAMTSGYGVSAAVCVGAAVYEGDIVVLFVQGKRKGQTNAIRMQLDTLDRLCASWIEYRKEPVQK
jgi:hypothetical protein